MNGRTRLITIRDNDMSESDDNKSTEYKQVAALLCLDIDILDECCEGCTDPIQLITMIKDLKSQKDEMLTNPTVRESRYNIINMLVGLEHGGHIKRTVIGSIE